MRRNRKRATLLVVVATVAVAALVIPAAAVAAGEQTVIPIDNPAVPWEFDDPCTGVAVHGLCHEVGEGRITSLGDQGSTFACRWTG